MTMTKEQGKAFIDALPEGEPFVIIQPRELSRKRREAVSRFAFQCSDSQKQALCTLYDAYIEIYGKSDAIDNWIVTLSQELANLLERNLAVGLEEGPSRNQAKA